MIKDKSLSYQRPPKLLKASKIFHSQLFFWHLLIKHPARERGRQEWQVRDSNLNAKLLLYENSNSLFSLSLAHLLAYNIVTHRCFENVVSENRRQIEWMKNRPLISAEWNFIYSQITRKCVWKNFSRGQENMKFSLSHFASNDLD